MFYFCFCIIRINLSEYKNFFRLCHSVIAKHNFCGCYKFKVAYTSPDTGWTARSWHSAQFWWKRSYTSSLCVSWWSQLDFAVYCWVTRCIWWTKPWWGWPATNTLCMHQWSYWHCWYSVTGISTQLFLYQALLWLYVTLSALERVTSKCNPLETL